MQNPTAAPITLASTSSYRRGLLDRFLDDYEVVSPDVDESNVDDLEAGELATALARRKAEAVSAQAPGSLIIGADQLAVLDGRILGKPGGHQAAVEQLVAAWCPPGLPRILPSRTASWSAPMISEPGA